MYHIFQISGEVIKGLGLKTKILITIVFSTLLILSVMLLSFSNNFNNKLFAATINDESETPGRDRLIGGLLTADFDEGSCLSRYHKTFLYRKPSPYKPSEYLVSKLRSYEMLHKRCGPGTKAYKEATKHLSHDENYNASKSDGECRYVVWLADYGLGNRLLTLASVFLYALLTDRIILVDNRKDIGDLLCEPFPGTSWLLPLDFPLMKYADGYHKGYSRCYGTMLENHSINSTSFPPHLYMHNLHDSRDSDKMFFCQKDQSLIDKVPWLIFRANVYFVPSLWFNPTFQTELLRSEETITSLSSFMASTLSIASPSPCSIPLSVTKVSPLKRKRPTHLNIPDLNPQQPISTDYFRFREGDAKVSPLKRKRPAHLNIPDLNPQQPIRTDYFSFTDFAHQNGTVSFGGNGFGVVSRNGKKKFMEDTHRIVPCLVGNSKKSFFGVYDGHGGAKAAEFVAENLHKYVVEMMENCKGKEEKVEAFKAAFLRTDRDFLEKGVVSGACCVTAVIQDQEMIVSNLGDCRAVLCRAGVAEALTDDHKPGRDDEKERIESQGGYVDNHQGAWRVQGILAVSRSIGDAHLKKWVVAEPETRVLELEQDMEFLVLASDGLWDVVSNQEAVYTVLHVLAQRKTPKESEEENLVQGFVNMSPSSKLRRASLVKSPRCAKSQSYYYNSENESPSLNREIGSSPSKSPITPWKSLWAKAACKELANLAAKRGSMDDITVVIIDLNHYKG